MRQTQFLPEDLLSIVEADDDYGRMPSVGIIFRQLMATTKEDESNEIITSAVGCWPSAHC